MIERALDLGDRVAAELKPPEKGPALKRESKRREKKEEVVAPPPPVVAPELAGKKPDEVSFRQVIEEWCQDHDLQFMPERNKVHAEGPLYRISGPEGKKGVLVYFKGNTLFAQVKDRNPIEIRRENEDEWGALMELVA